MAGAIVTPSPGAAGAPAGSPCFRAPLFSTILMGIMSAIFMKALVLGIGARVADPAVLAEGAS